MTTTAEPVSTHDLATAANTTVDQHWQRPGTTWKPACADCTHDGCPRLESAHQFLDRLTARALSS
ncbi:hypothetical protein [Micromonospora zhanjiangensis]|uniref:Uncharacterized protein n=1 Tax=Micromonospora zhanjiangensis TaxID=1522057 RepID=A0ABV8KV67_9ACTN